MVHPIIFTNGLKTETVEKIQLILNDNIRKEFTINWSYIIDGRAFFTTVRYATSDKTIDKFSENIKI
jgi:hypothetical protein